MRIPYIPIWRDGRDTSEWEKAILGILIALLLVGILTLWQIRLVVTPSLFQAGVAVYLLLLILTVITRFRILWVYPIDGLLGLGLFSAAVSRPEHFQIVLGGGQILSTFIIIVGDTLALLLAVTSLYVFWRRISPQMIALGAENQSVHANCAPDAPCRTKEGYRV